MWLFREVAGARVRAAQGDLLFGTIDTWLLLRMSGGVVHATDATNASRTLLLNLKTGQWDSQLLDIFGIPAACLPHVHGSSEVYGHTKGLDFLDDGIPIAGIAGDQQAALFGQACLESGQAKVTFGTGAFILMHTGESLVRSQHGLLTSIALKLQDQTTYCLEGSAFVAGAAVQWLRDGLGFIQKSSDIETLAGQVQDSGDLNFVPALSGLGAPHWRSEARGLLSGVSRGTTKGHIARAVLEGIALQNYDIMQAMQKDGVALKELRVDGGASANNILMQMQADFMNVRCLRPSNIEATALGAAALAGLAVALIENTEQIRNVWKAERVFEPQMPQGPRQNRIAKWQEAVAKA
jgi:glycerol kinase